MQEIKWDNYFIVKIKYKSQKSIFFFFKSSLGNSLTRKTGKWPAIPTFKIPVVMHKSTKEFLFICSCYPMVRSAIWEILSMFLMENISQYCTRQHAITALSFNACSKQIYRELSYLLVASNLLKTI